MRIEIPLQCPYCSGRMYSVSYDVPLRILQHRSWQYCKECGFVRDTEDYKKSLFTA